MTITPPEINDALIRSGYLLEARVEKYLADKWGAFVEANASYQDPETGKPREIDIHAIGGSIAGPGEYDYLFPVLLVECINNSQPIAFLTKVPPVQFLYSEEIKWSGIPLKIAGSGAKWESITDYLEMEKFHHYCKGRTATQFCSFLTKGASKNPQWMATHDETHFEAIRKLCDAVDYQMDMHMRSWAFEENESINLQIYYPAIIVQGELLDVRAGTSSLKISKTSHVQFRRSIAAKGEQRTYQLDVIQEKYLPNYLKTIDEEIGKTVRLLRRRHERIRVSIDKIAANAKRLRSPEKIRKEMEM